MGLGIILLVASITLVAVFVLLTDASPAAKVAVAGALVAALAVPRALPSLTAVCIALEAALAIGVILYLKAHGFVL